jgi:ketosteroid isomerase-like protein
MSEQNVEIVRWLQPPSGVDLVEVFVGGQFEQLPAFADPRGLFDPNLESSFIAGESAGSTTLSYRGPRGFVEGWQEWLAAWDRYRLENEAFIDRGDEVLVLVRLRARTRRGGVEMEHAPAAVWTLDNGKVVRIRFYLDRREALKAVGLQG